MDWARARQSMGKDWQFWRVGATEPVLKLFSWPAQVTVRFGHDDSLRIPLFGWGMAIPRHESSA